MTEFLNELLQELRDEILAEASDLDDLDESTKEDLPHVGPMPDRLILSDSASLLIDELMTSNEPASAEHRKVIVDKVDPIMSRRRQRSGFLERLLKLSRVEKGLTPSTLADRIAKHSPDLTAETLTGLEDGLLELRAAEPLTVAAWIYELEEINVEAESALRYSAQTTATPQGELAMAGDDDAVIVGSDDFVEQVLSCLRDIAADTEIDS